MPTYDYVCRACDCRFERFQKMSDGFLRKCPECGELKLKRLLGAGAAVIFKGSGFYETDYKRKSSVNGRATRCAGSSKSSSANGDGGEKEKKKADHAGAEEKKE